MDGLYHFRVGFPEGLNTKFGEISPKYSNHARQAALSDRYGHMELPKTINTDKALAVEVEISDNAVTKIVYRTKYNNDLDMVIVLTDKLTAKTVWFNKVSDRHVSLDRSKYIKPRKAA